MLGPGLSLQRYRDALAMFYGVYRPLEARLARFARSAPAGAVPLRTRAGLLEDDLVALGAPRADVAALPRCTRVPAVSRLEDAAGCLYVLEGACLGGQVIARALRHRLGVTRGTGASFFAGDGAGTAVRWDAFLTWLGEVAAAGACADSIASAAVATFQSFSACLDQIGARS